MLMSQTEILPLTGLRFVAAFYVFLFHIHIRWPLAGQPFLKNVLDQGAVGMSLFFVLSGFVLAYRYADGRSTIKDYLINRFARIYPIYVVAALITLPWIGIDFGYGSLTDIGKGIMQGALLIFANICLIQAWFLQFFSYWNDGGSWSISVEAFCYLLLPFILPRLAQPSIRRLYIIVAVCWLLAVLPGFSAALFNGPSTGVFYSMPIFRLPEFLIGACAYLAIRLGSSYRWGIIPQIVVLSFFLLYLGFVGPHMPLYVGHNWVALPTIALMIFSLSNGKGPIASLLANPVFVWLGKISYCFYSFQAFLILSLINYHDKLIQIAPLLANNRVLSIASLMVLIALSAAGHYLIEVPAHSWIKKRFHQKSHHLMNEHSNCIVYSPV